MERNPVEVKTSDEVIDKLDSMAIDNNKWQYLLRMQKKNPGEVYAGTVPLKEKKKRRAANKVARKQRKANRHG